MPTAPTGPPAGTVSPSDRSASGSGDGGPSAAGGDACPGALRLHTADDGALARVRVPGGVLTSRQAKALAGAAERLGDGVLHLTSRGNVQLRGLGAGCGQELATLLDTAGLLPSRGHERVRNVLASPLSGLDGRGAGDVGPWLRALDGLLCASDAARGLSGRFLFALDDGRGDVAALGADVTLTAVPGGGALLRLGTEAGTGALTVPGGSAALAALTAAEVFLDAAAAVPEGWGRVWRVGDLPGTASDALLPELVSRLARRGVGVSRGAAASSDVPDFSGSPDGPSAGVVAGPRPGAPAALSVLAPLGRLSAAQWRLLAECARTEGGDELRLTPWRGVVVPGVPAARAAERLAALAATGLITGDASPWHGVGACIGRPGCAKSLADVRADAADALVHSGTDDGGTDDSGTGDSGTGDSGTDDSGTDGSPALLPVHWSGCERRCGRPPGDRVDVVAAPEGYRVSVVRAGRPDPAVTPPPGSPAGLAAAVASARSRTAPKAPAPAPAP
ncbi:precorrin-3B synthase [Streptomyces amakusaensis]|uniref:Precorrin-3B synthase n=1 Tax=Streptomyces amakusaensis TaxID=67271 RepID=A0ABW0ARQ2_9ACTN